MTRNPILHTGLVLLSLLLPLPAIRAEEPALRDLLRDALYTEEVTRDPEQAAKQYEDLLSRHDAQKTFAAAALFRLAEVRRKQDRKDDAIQLYQRLIAEFPEAETETKLAKENLAALGGKMPETEVAAVDDEEKELKRLQIAAKSAPDVLLDSNNLAKAAGYGWPKVVRFLLASGARPSEGAALEEAAARGYLENVKLLTEKPDDFPEKVATAAIQGAIRNRRYTVLDYLLKKVLKPGNVTLDFGEVTMLTYALVEDTIPSAEILLKHGADLNEMVATDPGQGYEGMGAALHLAVSRGEPETVKWLLEKGAKPDLPTLHFGLTPLHYAAKSEHPGALDLMKRLLEAGADPNQVSNDREAPDSLAKTILLNATPLETAIASHSMSLEKAKLLLERKADPNRKNSRVSEMLALAIGYDDPNAGELVQLLGEAGYRMIDPKLMAVAISVKKPKLIELLLKYGADPNVKTSNGRTLFEDACVSGNVERVKLLLKNGANPKQPGLLGGLIESGPDAIPAIRLLLESGCDPNASDASEVPPIVRVFDWDLKNEGDANQKSAKHSKQVELIQLLLKHGADPNTTYGTFSRGPIGSGQRSMTGNRPSPFVEDSNDSKSYPESLLMKVVGLVDRQNLRNVSLIKILMDAGAKPTVEFPEVFDFVAQGDESLPIAKALLPFRPKTLKLDRSNYFLNWNPQVTRLFLDEVLNPALAGSGGIFLVDEDGGGCHKLLEANQPIPPMAELMLGNFDALLGYYSQFAGKRYEPVVTRVRRDAEGQWLRESIDLRGDAALPDLASGDIIELSKGKPVPDTENNDRAFANQLSWHLRKRVSFPVTVEIGGKPREITLRGDLLSYDPTKNEAPLLSAGHLAMLFLPASTDSGESSLKPNSILTIRRQGSSDIRMDLSASGAREFKLKSGDHLILPDPESVMETEDESIRPVRLVILDFGYSRGYQPVINGWIDSKPTINMPTLVQVLTDVYSPRQSGTPAGSDQALETRFPELSNRVQAGEVPVILPHPDFSRIRIKRIGGDRKEMIQDVDLSDAIRRCTKDTPIADVRKADVALFPGDVVELPLKTGPPAQPWQGFTAEEERFFHKALGGTVMVRKQDGIINPVEISYHQPEWKVTPHGLVPLPPKEGLASPRLFALTGMNGMGLLLKRDGHELRSNSGDPLLRDGDEIRVDASMQQPAGQVPPWVQRQSRPRVVPPPSPSSN